MRVFISWSGKESKKFAEVLNWWLPTVIQAVDTYFTPEDVDKGSRWGSAIHQELEKSNFGLICLTRDNFDSPWLNFEAGALSKKIDSSLVCPVLFNLDSTDLEGPLSLFQASRFEKEDFRQLLTNINNVLGEEGLESNTLDRVFETFWPELENEINQILQASGESDEKEVRSERDLLEEVVTLTRNINQEVGKRVSRRRSLISSDAVSDLVNKIGDLTQAFVNNNEPVPYFNMLEALDRPVSYFIKNINDEDGQIMSKFEEIKAYREKNKSQDLEDDIPF